jgi:hypothetical protein
MNLNRNKKQKKKKKKNYIKIRKKPKIQFTWIKRLLAFIWKTPEIKSDLPHITTIKFYNYGTLPLYDRIRHFSKIYYNKKLNTYPIFADSPFAIYYLSFFQKNLLKYNQNLLKYNFKWDEEFRSIYEYFNWDHFIQDPIEFEIDPYVSVDTFFGKRSAFFEDVPATFGPFRFFPQVDEDSHPFFLSAIDQSYFKRRRSLITNFINARPAFATIKNFDVRLYRPRLSKKLRKGLKLDNSNLGSVQDVINSPLLMECLHPILAERSKHHLGSFFSFLQDGSIYNMDKSYQLNRQHYDFSKQAIKKTKNVPLAFNSGIKLKKKDLNKKLPQFFSNSVNEISIYPKVWWKFINLIDQPNNFIPFFFLFNQLPFFESRAFFHSTESSQTQSGLFSEMPLFLLFHYRRGLHFNFTHAREPANFLHEENFIQGVTQQPLTMVPPLEWEDADEIFREVDLDEFSIFFFIHVPFFFYEYFVEPFSLLFTRRYLGNDFDSSQLENHLFSIYEFFLEIQYFLESQLNFFKFFFFKIEQLTLLSFIKFIFLSIFKVFFFLLQLFLFFFSIFFYQLFYFCFASQDFLFSTISSLICSSPQINLGLSYLVSIFFTISGFFYLILWFIWINLFFSFVYFFWHSDSSPLENYDLQAYEILEHDEREYAINMLYFPIYPEMEGTPHFYPKKKTYKQEEKKIRRLTDFSSSVDNLSSEDSLLTQINPALKFATPHNFLQHNPFFQLSTMRADNPFHRYSQFWLGLDSTAEGTPELYSEDVDHLHSIPYFLLQSELLMGRLFHLDMRVEGFLEEQILYLNSDLFEFFDNVDLFEWNLNEEQLMSIIEVNFIKCRNFSNLLLSLELDLVPLGGIRTIMQHLNASVFHANLHALTLKKNSYFYANPPLELKPTYYITKMPYIYKIWRRIKRKRYEKKFQRANLQLKRHYRISYKTKYKSKLKIKYKSKLQVKYKLNNKSFKSYFKLKFMYPNFFDINKLKKSLNFKQSLHALLKAKSKTKILKKNKKANQKAKIKAKIKVNKAANNNENQKKKNNFKRKTIKKKPIFSKRRRMFMRWLKPAIIKPTLFNFFLASKYYTNERSHLYFPFKRFKRYKKYKFSETMPTEYGDLLSFQNILEHQYSKWFTKERFHNLKMVDKADFAPVFYDLLINFAFLLNFIGFHSYLPVKWPSSSFFYYNSNSAFFLDFFCDFNEENHFQSLGNLLGSYLRFSNKSCFYLNSVRVLPQNYINDFLDLDFLSTTLKQQFNFLGSSNISSIAQFNFLANNFSITQANVLPSQEIFSLFEMTIFQHFLLRDYVIWLLYNNQRSIFTSAVYSYTVPTISTMPIHQAFDTPANPFTSINLLKQPKTATIHGRYVFQTNKLNFKKNLKKEFSLLRYSSDLQKYSKGSLFDSLQNYIVLRIFCNIIFLLKRSAFFNKQEIKERIQIKKTDLYITFRRPIPFFFF